MSNINVVVAYHSGYGHTAKVAEAVAAGAKSWHTEVSVEVIKVDSIDEAGWAKLDKAQAIIFGTPTYMGGVSAQFKAFADATSKQWMAGTWKNKIAAGFTNSGGYSGDKLSSLQYLATLAAQHSMIWVGQGETAPHKQGLEQTSPDDINRIGSWLGLMTQSNNESPEIQPPQGDLQTARLFGKRVAEITSKFNK